jgi:plastocyanin
MRTYGRVLVTVGLLVLGLGGVAAPAAAGGGGGCHRDMASGPTEGSGDTVALEELCMTPSVLRVEPGTVVTFVNHDEMTHNVYGSGMFVHELAPAGTAAFRFDDEGTFPYACTIHPGMVGAIAVGDGHRRAADTTSIVPVEVAAASVAVPTTAPSTTLAPVPLAASSERSFADDELPVVPAALALVTVGAVGYLAGRRRVSAS